MTRPQLYKLIIIFLAGMALWIALGMIKGKISERQSYRFQAEQSIRSSWTGEQTLLGPMLVVPYMLEYEEDVWSEKLQRNVKVQKIKKENAYFLPKKTQIDAVMHTSQRERGIYSVPVYMTQVQVKGYFNDDAIQSFFARKEITQDGKAYLALSVSDNRGLLEIPEIHMNNLSVAAMTGSGLNFSMAGFHANVLKKITAYSAIRFSVKFGINGMTTLRFIPTAQNSEVNLRSNWPHPKFLGAFLPVEHHISKKGYEAQWKTSEFSADYQSALKNCLSGSCETLFSTWFGVKHIDPIDIYLQAERAVNYGILFIVLTFVAFALFEVLQKISLHPIQYALAGANLAIFFLLLVALSEHLKFYQAYIISATACICILTIYLRAVLKSGRNGLLFSAAITLLYGILYLIITSEDHALIAGSLLLFSILSIVLISTRKIDWYQRTL